MCPLQAFPTFFRLGQRLFGPIFLETIHAIASYINLGGTSVLVSQKVLCQ